MLLYLRSATVEYGSPNYDIRSVVDSVDGEIVSIKKDIDTTKVGPQEIVVEVEKESNCKRSPYRCRSERYDCSRNSIERRDYFFGEGDSFDVLK